MFQNKKKAIEEKYAKELARGIDQMDVMNLVGDRLRKIMPADEDEEKVNSKRDDDIKGKKKSFGEQTE